VAAGAAVKRSTVRVWPLAREFPLKVGRNGSSRLSFDPVRHVLTAMRLRHPNSSVQVCPTRSWPKERCRASLTRRNPTA